jgi:predicted CDP-diglyceride synthetase/phosphatidate cytidylyltransferase
MNWLEGAGDPLLLRALPIVAAVLGVAGLALLALTPVLRRRRGAMLRELWFRWALWVAIAALVLGALEGGRVSWVAAVALLTFAVLREYVRAVGLWQDWGMRAVLYAFILLAGACAYGGVLESDPEPGSYGLFIVLPVWGTVFLLAVPVLRGAFQTMLQRLALAIFGLVYLVFFLGHYAFMINLPGGVGLVLFLSFLVAANDVLRRGEAAGPARAARDPVARQDVGRRARRVHRRACLGVRPALAPSSAGDHPPRARHVRAGLAVRHLRRPCDIRRQA